MHCPYCGFSDTKVIDSRLIAEGKQTILPLPIPASGGDTSAVDLEDTSSASNSSSEMSDAMYAGS